MAPQLCPTGQTPYPQNSGASKNPMCGSIVSHGGGVPTHPHDCGVPEHVIVPGHPPEHVVWTPPHARLNPVDEVVQNVVAVTVVVSVVLGCGSVVPVVTVVVVVHGSPDEQ